MWDLSKLKNLGTSWCDVRAFVSIRYAKTVETFNRGCIVGFSIPQRLLWASLDVIGAG